ncbi:MAG: serpin family protein [Firmicutes bacterium]|nr:serpin family protein [Bacillota bacterium]
MKRLIALFAAVTAIGGSTAAVLSHKQADSFVTYEQTAPETGKALDAQTPQAVVGTGFANELDAYMPTDRNYMFSPLSIKTALALAANGAEGETKEKMLEMLEIDDIDAFNAYTKQLIADAEKNDKAEFSIADSIWLNEERLPGAKFSDDFEAKAKEFFAAEVKTVGYNDAVEKINSWCSEKTKGKINEMIDDPDFLAALINAVYFKGEWSSRFKEENTHKMEFTDRDGNKKETDFMRQTDRFAFYEDKNTKIIRLPYADGKTAMYIALNNDKKLDILSYADKMTSCKVHIELPKFKTEFSCDLNDALAKLGAERAFNADFAEFKPMFKDFPADQNFYIDTVLHKTYIDVNESGTEAAAATAVMMRNCTTSVEKAEEIKEFIADKPFSYVIADTETNEILFMGEQAY